MPQPPGRPARRRFVRLPRRKRTPPFFPPPGDDGFGPPDAGVREPRRPKPTLPALTEALPDPYDPQRT